MILSFGSAASEAAAFVPALAWLSLLALLAYGAAALITDRAPQWLRVSLVVGWVLHAMAIVVDTSGMGAPTAGARFGFAPALSVTLWLVIAVYVAETRFLPLTGIRRSLALLGASAVALALLFPGEARPLAPSRWAPLHWVLGIASYGLFGAAVLHAAMLNRADRQMRQLRQKPLKPDAPAAATGLPLLRLERLTFRFVAAGFVVLTATLVLGWWFSNPWRWDHKTVLSMLGWLVFAALLVGRRSFGWRGRQATRWVYSGAGLLLLAYVGSRFVFEVVLHRPLPA